MSSRYFILVAEILLGHRIINKPCSYLRQHDITKNLSDQVIDLAGPYLSVRHVLVGEVLGVKKINEIPRNAYFMPVINHEGGRLRHTDQVHGPFNDLESLKDAVNHHMGPKLDPVVLVGQILKVVAPTYVPSTAA